MLQNAVMPPACASLGTLHPNHRSLPARPTLSLSPSPRLRRSRPAAYSRKSSVPTVDDVLPTGDGPGGQGRNTPSDPAREILAGGAELPGRGGDPDASTTEQGEGEASE
jgi:hypothetical protein